MGRLQSKPMLIPLSLTGTPFDIREELLSSYGEHSLMTDQGRHLALIRPLATSQHVFRGQRAAWPLILDEWENPQALREYRKGFAGSLLQEKIPDPDVRENHTTSTAIHAGFVGVWNQGLQEVDPLGWLVQVYSERQDVAAITSTGSLRFVGELKAPWLTTTY
ncbi:hypothetical protein ATEIFO6365_0002063200 [Aspergillus terreus]|uniref:Uncharacterized protein n=1 Tax=Aspergillus terreus TaxID=33178 RepID=A0A8H3MLL9_ASPTE|nr:hypothetical protein ATEIFO6365_0002063200 [Aspergillus terreus]